MARGDFDFAVVGSTPLAHLLAGQLAGRHRKRVCLLADPPSPLRLDAGLDASLGLITRPESWQLLAQLIPETRKILARIGGVARRCDPIIAARSGDGRAALAHLRQLALGFGFAAEPLPVGTITDHTACRLRDATLIDRTGFAAAIAPWHRRNEVHAVPYSACHITLLGGGACSIRHGVETFEAAQTILADDAAVLAHSVVADYRILHAVTQTVIRSEPTNAPRARLLLLPDAGVMLSQRNTGAIDLFLSDHHFAHIPDVIALAFRHRAPVRQAGRAHFPALLSRDGAAVIGVPGQPRPIILAALGPSGAFLAPALARYVTGTATPAESQYFAARSPGAPRRTVHEFIAFAAAAA